MPGNTGAAGNSMLTWRSVVAATAPLFLFF